MSWIQFATPAFGAFFGALGAYCVGRFKESRDTRKERHSALLATQFALHSQWNILHDIRTNFLDPARDEPNRWTRLQIYFRNPGEQFVPFDRLTFILQSQEPNLLQEIHIAENTFLSVLRTLDARNEARREVLSQYPPFQFNPQKGSGHTLIPQHEAYKLGNLTDMLYADVDKALPLLGATNRKVALFVKRQLHGCNALDFELPEHTTPPSGGNGRANDT